MKRRSLSPLGETEMEILQHVWDLGDATVSDVLARVIQQRPIAYTTVMTVLRNLADKGYLQFEKEGASYVYSAARPAEDVRRTLLRGVIAKVFRGSSPALVRTLVTDEALSPVEAEAIRKLIDHMDASDHG